MSMDQSPMGGTPMDEWGTHPACPEWQGPPQKKDRGFGCQLLIVLGVLFGLFLLLCCAGLVSMTWYVVRSVSDDPEVVKSIREEIVEIDVPEEFRPAFSVDMKVPFSERTIVKGVFYVDEASESVLALGTTGKGLSPEGREQMRRQIKIKLRQEGVAYEEDLEDWERSQREVEVRGQKVSFDFAVGTPDDSQTERLQVNGVFEGEEGPVLFFFFGDPEKYDEQAVVEIIESIR